jgi:molybdopterin synthase catalytic subunit
MISVPLLTPDPIDVEGLEQRVRGEETGAVVTFQGVLRRDRLREIELSCVYYEADASAAERELQGIVRQVQSRWPGTAVLLQHRLGRVAVGETSVFMAVSSLERSQAFEACRLVAEGLKALASMKKKDVNADGTSHWSPDPHATILISDDVIQLPES